MAETAINIVDALRGQQEQLKRLLAQPIWISNASKATLSEMEAQVSEITRLLAALEKAIKDIDAVSKKNVLPIDTLCLSHPNARRVGEPAEYMLWDRVGDGKIDFKIVYKFASDVDLWIVYGRRDGNSHPFRLRHGRKGKPDRWVPVNPPHR